MKILFLLLAAAIIGPLLTWTPPTFTQGLMAGLGLVFLLQLVVLILILP